MKRHVRGIFWVESSMAVITASLAVLTPLWPDWVEGMFGFNPDRHGGSFEWALVVVCCFVTVALASLARREWRRAVVAA